MTSVIAHSAIAPLFREPTLRSEQVSQLVLGETGAVEDERGEWRRISSALDGYSGWVHRGYVMEVDDGTAARWRNEARGWSLGATLRVGAQQVRLPLRARVVIEGDTVRCPNGRRGSLVDGAIPSDDAARRTARGTAAEHWALEHFAGAPYAWGGVTPWGVDCSGLIQTTFTARGVTLPRDSAQQAECGTAVPPEAIRPGDLLFFRGDDGGRITHVAFAAAGDTLIHATVGCGGVLQESRLPGSRAAPLMERLAAVRRVAER
jgi:hypothetical protein